MSKRQKRKSKVPRNKLSLREQLRRRSWRARPADFSGVDPRVADVITQAVGGIPTRGTLGDMEQAATQAVLGQLVTLELAKWLNNSMLVLQNEFGFDQEQLTHYARTFREAMTDEQTPEPAE